MTSWLSMLRFDCKRQLFPPKILQSTQIPLPLNVIINYRMKSNNRFFLGLLLLLSHFSAFAQQYVVKGGSHEPMLAINEISYKLKVYVLDGTENASISYTSSSTNHQWKRYKTNYLEAEHVNSHQQGTTSVITMKGHLPPHTFGSLIITNIRSSSTIYLSLKTVTPVQASS